MFKKHVWQQFKRECNFPKTLNVKTFRSVITKMLEAVGGVDQKRFQRGEKTTVNFKDQPFNLFILNYLTLCSIKRCIPYSLKDANGEHNKWYKTNEAEEKNQSINKMRFASHYCGVNHVWRECCLTKKLIKCCTVGNLLFKGVSFSI